MCVCSATTFRPRRLGGLEEGEGVGVDLQDLIEMHRLELLVLVLVLRGQGGGVVCGGDAGGGVEVLWEGAAREAEGEGAAREAEGEDARAHGRTHGSERQFQGGIGALALRCSAVRGESGQRVPRVLARQGAGARAARLGSSAPGDDKAAPRPHAAVKRQWTPSPPV